jgi:hypothetical protein
MSKRNAILLIIVLAVVIAVVFGFMYVRQPQSQTTPSTGGTNFFANFFPFGKSINTTPANTTPPTNISRNEPPTSVEFDLKLKKVSSFPVAGFGIFMKERFKEAGSTVSPQSSGETTGSATKPTLPATEFAPALRYVNKATGNIYQTFADKIDERKFSSNIVPEVHDAYFGNKGDSVVMRYLKPDNSAIETFVGSLQKEYLGADSVGTNTVTGSFLPENISDLSVSPDALKVFYIFNIGDTSAGVTYSLQTGAKIQVFDSPFTEWLSFWPNNKMVTVSTKPSANVPGFMYAINPDKKDFNKILGGINGLTTLTSPDGKTVLYGDNNLSLSIFDISTGVSTLLGVKTLPEKCAWGAGSDVLYCAVPKYIDNGEYPDSWYQGEVSFSDQIWKIDAKSGNTAVLLDPTSIVGIEDMDITKLSLDETQNYLLFVNKKDSYLWEFNLK